MSVKYLWLSAAVIGWWGSSLPVIGQNSQPVSLAWNASVSPSVAGYSLYYGTASGSYSRTTNVGNQTAALVNGLQAGQTYFFAVTAYDATGLESPPSNEVSYQVPLATNPPPTLVLTAPAAGTTYTAPAVVQCAASVVANGHNLGNVQFYGNTALLGQCATAPYGLCWTNSTAGNCTLFARLSYDATNTLDSQPVTITVTSPPPVVSLTAPWQTMDIGSSTPGSAGQSNGVYTVTGAGALSGTADAFRFVYQPLTGDGEVRAQLTAVGANGANGCIGVMIRESLTPGSKYAFMGVNQKLTFLWQRRSSTAGSTASSTGKSALPPNLWVRVARSGNTLTGYSSTNGVTWVKVASRSISMAVNGSIGLVVASGNTNILNTSTFSNVSVVP